MKAKGTPLGNREELSALVDGEFKKPTAKIVITSITSGNELFATWERYHLIGEIMRKNIPPQIIADYSLVGRVRKAIDEEPVVVRSRWQQWLDSIKSKFSRQ